MAYPMQTAHGTEPSSYGSNKQQGSKAYDALQQVLHAAGYQRNACIVSPAVVVLLTAGCALLHLFQQLVKVRKAQLLACSALMGPVVTCERQSAISISPLSALSPHSMNAWTQQQ